ncbi:hypothetical protein [Saccharococcus sp. Marseille-Q5394]|uniref:hypothetical protein n=1 Tax=Saccharococcus sp. Marseille-Q5394 TaxID=2972778 RepID=UPI0021C764F6|nr:hypothetical protein [Saccharococcus sp. Marseille-Q5394]
MIGQRSQNDNKIVKLTDNSLEMIDNSFEMIDNFPDLTDNHLKVTDKNPTQPKLKKRIIYRG